MPEWCHWRFSAALSCSFQRVSYDRWVCPMYTALFEQVHVYLWMPFFFSLGAWVLFFPQRIFFWACSRCEVGAYTCFFEGGSYLVWDPWNMFYGSEWFYLVLSNVEVAKRQFIKEWFSFWVNYSLCLFCLVAAWFFFVRLLVGGRWRVIGGNVFELFSVMPIVLVEIQRIIYFLFYLVLGCAVASAKLPLKWCDWCVGVLAWLWFNANVCVWRFTENATSESAIFMSCDEYIKESNGIISLFFARELHSLVDCIKAFIEILYGVSPLRFTASKASALRFVCLFLLFINHKVIVHTRYKGKETTLD